jgi:hypothetical protein
MLDKLKGYQYDSLGYQRDNPFYLLSHVKVHSTVEITVSKKTMEIVVLHEVLGSANKYSTFCLAKG